MFPSMNQPLSVAFFGTHQFAATILDSLVQDPQFDVVAVFTQPDRPVGRKQILQAPPVKVRAENHNISHIHQPPSLKQIEIESLLPTIDVIVVAQYGLLIPSRVLAFPTHGCINVHTSLLPKYRGGAPIRSALLAGETKTGVTIMLMDKGLDTGPILTQHELTVDPHDTHETLDVKLARLGATAIVETIPRFVSGDCVPQSQDESKATTCSQFSRDDGRVDWNKSNADIYNMYRAFTPWPGIWTTHKGKRIKLLSVSPSQKKLAAGQVHIENDTIHVGCGMGSLNILELQLEGKKKVSASDFVRGHQEMHHHILEN